MGEQTSDFYEFGRFRLKSDERVLLRGDELVPLTPKAFDILLTLLENDGRIVPKDDLMKKVWPNTFVEEGNLTQNVSLLRKALGESATGPQFIETVPRRGYRFVAPVNRINGNGVDNGGAYSGEHPGAATSSPSVARKQSAKPGGANPELRTSEVGLWTRFSPVTDVTKKRLAALALTLAAVVVTVVAIAYLSGRGKAGASTSAIESIAVLPFVDDSLMRMLNILTTRLPKVWSTVWRNFRNCEWFRAA